VRLLEVSPLAFSPLEAARTLGRRPRVVEDDIIFVVAEWVE
jgi:hypothetical protein